MYPRFFLISLLCSLVFPLFVSAQTDPLDQYVNRLKISQKSGGSETAFLSIGSDFLYAQEYYEAGNYSAAAYSFMAIVQKDKEHPFANYQLALSLLKQNDVYKTKQAQEYLDKAFIKEPLLKDRFKKELPSFGNDNKKEATVKDKTGNTTNTTGTDGLDNYIEQIKYSRATGGKETVMLSAGLEAFYGIEYYEAANYRSAETAFSLSLAVDPANPYVNYMMAVSLAAQGKDKEAKPFLAKAVAGDKALEKRFTKDAAAAATAYKQSEASKNIKAQPAAPVKYGGKLVYGNYTCHQSIWNGPNTSPAYSSKYHGYFQLRKDGTYRWLDNGVTGRYSYNEKTGEITWLSGYFKAAPPKKSLYQPNTKVAQVNLKFSDNYTWQCGCKQ